VAMIDEPSQLLLLGLSVLSFALAWLTWKYIEAPFRNRSLFRRTTVFTGFGLGTAIIIATSLFLQTENGLLARLSPEARSIAAFSDDTNPRREQCNSSNDHVIAPDDSCIYGTPSSADVAIMGDSHAEALTTSLANALSIKGHGLREFTYRACLPFRGLHRIDNPNDRYTSKCETYANQVHEYLGHHPEVKTIVIANRWTFYLEGTRFDNGEGGREEGSAFANPPERPAAVADIIKSEIKAYLDMGKKVILIYPIPEAGWDVPKTLARQAAYGIARKAPLSTSWQLFATRNQRAIKMLDAIGEQPNLARVYPSQLFCNTFIPERCALQANGQPLYFDDDHPSSIGAKLIAEKILDSMQ
jgi:hypothetical protein